MTDFKTQLRSNRKAVRAEAPRHEATQPQNPLNADALSPLHERLKSLLESIPAQEQHTGLSLTAIQELLPGGRPGRHVHIGLLARAFRRLGWKSYRGWAGQAESRNTRWFPPGHYPDEQKRLWMNESTAECFSKD